MLANQRVTQPSQQLRALRNITTNQPITRFPRDLAAVQAITSLLKPYHNLLDQLLTCAPTGVNTFRQFMAELGLDVPNDWPISTARQDFRQAIGCSPI
jgi:ABC-type transporter Mla subunit MlaD